VWYWRRWRARWGGRGHRSWLAIPCWVAAGVSPVQLRDAVTQCADSSVVASSPVVERHRYRTVGQHQTRRSCPATARHGAMCCRRELPLAILNDLGPVIAAANAPGACEIAERASKNRIDGSGTGFPRCQCEVEVTGRDTGAAASAQPVRTQPSQKRQLRKTAAAAHLARTPPT
jgi:hypothetical protein